MQTHEAYGVVDKDGLCIMSIADTRRSAIVNWLGVKASHFCTYMSYDHEIEAAWRAKRRGARVHKLSVLVGEKVDDRL